VKNQDPDPGCLSRIIFPSAWKQFFGLKILEFFDADLDSGWVKNQDPDPGQTSQIRNTDKKIIYQGQFSLTQSQEFS
jgi:hypothetical protein